MKYTDLILETNSPAFEDCGEDETDQPKPVDEESRMEKSELLNTIEKQKLIIGRLTRDIEVNRK